MQHDPRLPALSPAIAILFALIVGLVAAVAAEHQHLGHESHRTVAESQVAQPHGLAETTSVIGLRLQTVDGEVVHLGLTDDSRPVAVVFLNDGCTISRRYVRRLNELAELAGKAGVDFFTVVSNPAITWQAARSFRDEYQLHVPLLFDANGELARQLEPQTVPSAFVVDLAGRITYRGRIDDRFPALTKARREARSHDLLRAIEAVAAGRVEHPVATPAVGCVFNGWPETEATPTYTSNIAPILDANCVECHRPGGVAPFALDDYGAAKRWSTMTAAVTRAGLMPPWSAERDFGHFRQERFLSPEQIGLLSAWASAGAPLGEPAMRLPKPTFETSEWQLGPPDLELTMPAAFSVPADGEDIYRYFVLPMGELDDAVVVAMDFKPGDASVVHHCNYFVDYSGRARRLDRRDPGPGFSVFGTGGFMSYDGANALGAWAPGVGPYRLPTGRGFDLPGGGDIVLEVHYHLTGKPTMDQSSIAFYFADEPVERGVTGLMVGTQDVDIPAGEAHYWRRVTMEVPVDMELVDISPHMHYLGREARVVAKLPDGEELPLLHVTDWDLRWQGIYTYRQPQLIPAGSTLEALFRFDNSSSNSVNPNSPPRRVKWGWGSDQEMAELYLTVIQEDRRAVAKLRRASRAAWQRPADLDGAQHAQGAGR
ncbi:MAG: redoxin family protein [Acidobacteriota bacterium]